MAGHKTSKKGSKLSKGISYSFKHDDFAKFRKYQKQKYGSKGSKDSKDNKHRNLNRQISNKKLQKSTSIRMDQVQHQPGYVCGNKEHDARLVVDRVDQLRWYQ